MADPTRVSRYEGPARPRRALLATVTAVVVGVGLAAGPAPAQPVARPVDPSVDLERVPGVTGPVSTEAAPEVETGPSARTTAGDPDAAMSQRLTALSGPLLPGFSGSVAEASTGATRWSRQAMTPLRPASTQKLMTATTALRTFGTTHRFVTPVSAAGTKGDYVYLRGVGDPTLSSYRLDQMARSAASRLKAEGVTSVRLRVDDTLFPAPTNAPGWQPEDVLTYVTPVRSLVVDQRDVADTSMDAASVFRSKLGARGIRVVETRRARTPAGATRIASGNSPQLEQIVADLLRESQNDYAESLLWAAGMEGGAARSWAGVGAYSKKMVAGYGVPTGSLVFADGSGVSRSDRLTGGALTTLLVALYRHPSLSKVVFAPDALPVAGRSGTLANRFQAPANRCAVGRVQAKTGSLNDTSAMAGVAHGVDGTPRVFALISNGAPGSNTPALRDRIDALAATATTCR